MKDDNIEVNVDLNKGSNVGTSGQDFQTTNTQDGVQQEPWFKKYWRPAAAWLYLGVCAFDFVGAPIFMAWWAYFTKAALIVAWTPLTLGGGAIFHLAFGAIIGIYAWGRTREKLASQE